MAKFTVNIIRVTTNGPYAYSITKDGAGAKAEISQASISAALDGVKTDIGNLLSGETVQRVAMDITSS